MLSFPTSYFGKMFHAVTGVLFITTFVSAQIRIPLKYNDVEKYEENPGDFIKRNVENLERKYNGGTTSALSLINDQDVDYYAAIKIGTPGQTFNILFDTTSGDFWVPSSQCIITDIPCWRHNDYYCDKSSTYEADGRPYTINSVFGTGVGHLSKDVVTIGNLTVTNQTFAEITWLGQDFLNTKFDGILGLGFTSLSQSGEPPPFINLVHQGQLLKPFFALYLTSKGGELSFAYTNRNYFQGKFDFVPVLKPASYWSFNLTQLTVGGNDVGVNYIAAILDSATQLITGPAIQIRQINNAIGASYKSGQYQVNCKKINDLPPVTLAIDTVKNVSVTISSQDYVIKIKSFWSTTCITAFSEIKLDIPNTFVLGNIFLRKVYTQFNTGHGTIGFAQAI